MLLMADKNVVEMYVFLRDLCNIKSVKRKDRTFNTLHFLKELGNFPKMKIHRKIPWGFIHIIFSQMLVPIPNFKYEI